MPIAACCVLALSVSCAPTRQAAQPAEPPVQQSASGKDLSEFIRAYQTDRGGVLRFYELPWSQTRFDRAEKLIKEWQERLSQVDFGALDQQGKIDYVLLRGELDSEVAHGKLDRDRLTEMDQTLPFRATIQALELSRWKMETVDAPSAAAKITEIPDQVKKVRERIEKGRKDSKKSEGKGDAAKADSPKAEDAGAKPEKPEAEPIKLTPVVARRAAAAVGEIRGTLRDWFDFYNGYQPEFSWWLKKPYDEAASALDDYSKFLREEIAGQKGKDEDPLVGDPIGATGLADDLAAEFIPYTPEQLIGIANVEFAWCEAEMKKAAKDMGLGDDWKAALKKVKDDYVPPGKQDALVADYSRFIIKYLHDKDLVTIPPLCEETWRLTMISPQAQRTYPFAYYGGQHMAVAYPTDAMKNDDKLMSMRGNNKHFTRIVTPHELIPGHHLQGFMAQRVRNYRQMFSTPFLVEGWALYWEMTLWELGYPQSPEDRVGMLFWRMHRAARIIVSLKFHLGQMTPQEMVDFLVDRVGHERSGATGEVRRFISGDYSPLYQCGYMIGGLQLRAMRKDLVDSGKMTNRQFHDAILTSGPTPVELNRDGMAHLPLDRDSKPSWKFAGEEPGK